MKLALLCVAALCTALCGCNTSQTAITAAICADANTLQSSSLNLNQNETTALNGVISTCNNTAGGTSFNNATLALALINDAILLQSSGLFSEIHITAQAPEQQVVLEKMKFKWENLALTHSFK